MIRRGEKEGGGGGVRLRKEAASEQRGNKGLVSPSCALCGYYIAPGASTVDGAYNVSGVSAIRVPGIGVYPGRGIV